MIIMKNFFHLICYMLLFQLICQSKKKKNLRLYLNSSKIKMNKGAFILTWPNSTPNRPVDILTWKMRLVRFLCEIFLDQYK